MGESASYLEDLLVAAAHDPARRPEFTAALLHSDVLVLGEMRGDIYDGVAQVGSEAVLMTFSDEDGPYTPFFTSEQRIWDTVNARPGTDPRYLGLNCRTLFETTLGSRLVLNPDSPYGKIFLRDEIAALISGQEVGVTQETLEAGRRVMVGAAEHVPPALHDVLARFFDQRPTVEAAYLGWIAHPDGASGFLLVVIAPDRDAAMHGFGTLQVGELTDGATVDVMVVPVPDANPLSQVVAPFYTPTRRRGR